MYIGSDWKNVSNKRFDRDFTLRAGYEITERTIDKYGQFNLVLEAEVETRWTNLTHGECEQFHSEVKNDMNLERLPSGKFTTNAFILELAIVAYNILRMIDQHAISERTPHQKCDIRRYWLYALIGNLYYDGQPYNYSCPPTDYGT